MADISNAGRPNDKNRPITMWHLRIINALLTNKDLKTIYLAALQDPDVSRDRLRNELARSISAFGQNLESESPAFVGVGSDLQLNTMAYNLAANILQDTLTIEKPELHSSQIALFREISDSNAYLDFGRRMLSLVLEGYRKRIAEVIGPIAFGEDSRVIDKGQLYAVSRQLSMTPRLRITFTEGNTAHMSLLARFEAWVDEHKGKEWPWPPFTPAVQDLRRQFCRLAWKGAYGDWRYVDVQERRMPAMKAVFASAPNLPCLEPRYLGGQRKGLAVRAFTLEQVGTTQYGWVWKVLLAIALVGVLIWIM